MDIAALIKAIVTPLVTHPDAIVITPHETEDYMAFDLTVAPDDVGRIIGKQGRVAQAIRTIVYAVKSPYSKRVRLNILDASHSEQ
ncbi:MAG: KH domain-containing protein [Lactobacillus sp.]|uniref:RNA-binding protein KhpA n=1 Tax=Lacticaseibacillus suilingensis TaxID=2799577 RepID=A0ABW4BFA8_9LACO|nr:KH domain-containing protein [Lacticaseibacillus suilingensis]MCI1895193.1 KH domain-containing protein [Lactobacillus sp.]MCI1918131.1 KH domain-containing protein [Lactobacillus sp.]MCI1940727.1 KH domain-containing protein [Lactobacillus sp.]MCI1971413.1 KH domain-containing protein [Lactobacillus sp.]MCI2016500.1 KH domain-containing protein [Lactobacillus sp.]